MVGCIVIEDDLAQKELWLAKKTAKYPINEVKNKSIDHVSGGFINPKKVKLGVKLDRPKTDKIEWHAAGKLPAPPGKQYCKPGMSYVAVCRLSQCDFVDKCKVLDKIAVKGAPSYALSGR